MMEDAIIDIRNALNTSMHDIQQGIQMHCCLIDSMLEGNLDDSSMQALVDRCPKRSRERKLEAAVSEAIDVLEATRKAFKSKQLEILRKKLMRTLIEAN